MWAKIDPTGNVWSTCSLVVPDSLWIRGQFKKIAILWIHEILCRKLTLFTSVYFTEYVSISIRVTIIKSEYTHRCTTRFNSVTRVRFLTNEYEPGASINPSAKNVFMGTLQGILGVTTSHIQVLVEDGYDTQESVLYWKFIDINEWWHLRYKIHVIYGGISFRDRKIKCLQALAWWLMNLTLLGKNNDLNRFKSDVLFDKVEDSQLKFEKPEMVMGSWLRPNIFHMINGLNWDKEFTTASCYRKKVVVWPYHMSSEEIHEVLMTEITGMCRSYIKQVFLEICS